jgi:hypothetical protein
MTDDHQVAGFILQALTPRLDTIVWSHAGNLSRAPIRMEARGHDLCRLPGTLFFAVFNAINAKFQRPQVNRHTVDSFLTLYGQPSLWVFRFTLGCAMLN